MLDNKTILQQTKEALERAIADKKISQEMLKSLAPAIIETLTPVLQEIAVNSKITKEEILDVISQIKISVPNITVPEANVKVQIPEIKVPEAKVSVDVKDVKMPEIDTTGIEKALKDGLTKFKLPKPEVNVNVPKIDMPKFEWPKSNMPIEGWVRLMGVDLNNPLPVQLRDANGKPVSIDVTNNILGGGGGGGRGIVKIGGIEASAFGNIVNPDGRVKVEMPAGSSGLTDAELRASHLDTLQLSGSIDSVKVTGFDTSVGATILNGDGVSLDPRDRNWTIIESLETRQISGYIDSVSVKEIFNSASADIVNADGRLKVSVETGGSGLTDSELRASHLDVQQLDGSIWSVAVKEIFNSTAVDLINPDGRLKVELPNGASGLTDTELRASHLDVLQLSGAIDSVFVTGIFNSTSADIINPDNRLKVELPSGASGLTDTELRALHLDTLQLSGSIDSVKVTGFDTSVGATILNGEGLARDSWLISDITASVKATIIDSTGIGYSGSNPLPIGGNVAVTGITGSVGATILNGEGLARDSWLISDITASVKASLIDSSGVQYSGGNPVPVGDAGGSLTIDGTVAVSGITNSVGVTLLDGDGLMKATFLVSDITASTKSALIDSGGVQYSGSNPVPVTLISGALVSTIAVGAVVSDAADDNSAPIKGGGIARQANPTAVSAGDIVSSTHDDLGRQVMRPVQVRDLIKTAYVSLVTGSAFGTETTLLASGSAKLLDLIYIMGANDSDKAILVQLRASTAGTVLMSIELPAGGTAGVALPVPLPGPFADHTWTVDMPDVSGTNVQISALFTEEV